ncbi:MAG: phosphatidylglycerophosphatase A [Acidobacteriota bacterium]
MTPPTLRSQSAVVLATFGYVGFAPFAPGTVGSAAALVVFVPLRLAANPWIEVLTSVALFFAGVWAARVTEQHLGVDDPGPVVIDEVVGMLVSLLFLPFSWPVVAAAFVAFRCFDIVKPWPAGRLESLHGGWGIMADDVMAAIYANLLVHLLVWFRPEWMR